MPKLVVYDGEAVVWQSGATSTLPHEPNIDCEGLVARRGAAFVLQGT
jgi:hypothetical protein